MYIFHEFERRPLHELSNRSRCHATGTRSIAYVVVLDESADADGPRDAASRPIGHPYRAAVHTRTCPLP